MKVPLSWLSSFLDLHMTPQALADLLTGGGLEVEEISSPPLKFSGVIVGKVLNAEKHPDADRLKVATVFDGKENLQIVCGAPNCREGIHVALATVGASLPLAEGGSFKIKKRKIRGIESCGMLCAASELGLSEEGEGILELPPHFAEGTPLEQVYGEVILEISLTPNLGHCMSMLGIAREISALLNIPLKQDTLALTEGETKTSSLIDIEILSPLEAPLFACRIVQDITVTSSPAWLQNKLLSAGLRPINALVDVGNFVMLELGTPLHIFDYDKLQGNTLSITTHSQEKELETLDGLCRLIPEGVPLVCDQAGPLSFGGVLGGKRSSVTDQTKNVLIEAAYFTPQAIRKSSKLLGVKTESSLRFEKGTDPCGLDRALNRAALLIEEICGGKITQGIVKKEAAPFEKKKIFCSLHKVNQILGTHLSLRDLVTLLKRADLKILKEEDAGALCQIPSYRGDLLLEIDLIEEVARLYGYNQIPRTKARHHSSTLSSCPLFLIEKEIRNTLSGFGLQEMITCDLISPSLAEMSLGNTLSKDSLISVLAPSSIDQSVLRASLLPGLLESLKFNHAGGFKSVHSFEVGRIHFKEKEHFLEYSSVALLLTGDQTPYHFDPKPQIIDFFDLKGIVEKLLLKLHIPEATFVPSHLPTFHPSKQAKILIDSYPIGVIGEIHPRLVTNMKDPSPIYFAELSIDSLLSLLPKEHKTTPPIVYLGSERDWTIPLPESTPIGPLLSAIKTEKSSLLEKVSLLDLYKSCQIGKDRKNVTLRFFYRDPRGTLDQAAVDQEHLRITQRITELFHLSS